MINNIIINYYYNNFINIDELRNMDLYNLSHQELEDIIVENCFLCHYDDNDKIILDNQLKRLNKFNKLLNYLKYEEEIDTKYNSFLKMLDHKNEILLNNLPSLYLIKNNKHLFKRLLK